MLLGAQNGCWGQEGDTWARAAVEEGVQRWSRDGVQSWGQGWLIHCSATQKGSDVRNKEGFDTEHFCPREREL